MLRIPADKIRVVGGLLNPTTTVGVEIELNELLVCPTLVFDNLDLDLDEEGVRVELASFHYVVFQNHPTLKEILYLRDLHPTEGSLHEDIFSAIVELSFIKSLKDITFSVGGNNDRKRILACLVRFTGSRHRLDATLEGVDEELGRQLFQLFFLD